MSQDDQVMSLIPQYSPQGTGTLGLGFRSGVRNFGFELGVRGLEFRVPVKSARGVGDLSSPARCGVHVHVTCGAHVHAEETHPKHNAALAHARTHARAHTDRQTGQAHKCKDETDQSKRTRKPMDRQRRGASLTNGEGMSSSFSPPCVARGSVSRNRT